MTPVVPTTKLCPPGARAEVLQRFKVDDLVQYWHDDGRGGSVLYGVVIAAGSKVLRVRWESGLSNRIRQGTHLVLPARGQNMAREAMATVCRHSVQQSKLGCRADIAQSPVRYVGLSATTQLPQNQVRG